MNQPMPELTPLQAQISRDLDRHLYDRLGLCLKDVYLRYREAGFDPQFAECSVGAVFLAFSSRFVAERTNMPPDKAGMEFASAVKLVRERRK